VTVLPRAAPRVATAVALATLVLAAPAEAQCAMCRSVFGSAEGQQLAAAFRAGILFLLAAPFAAFAVVAGLAIRSLGRLPDAPGRDA